MPLYQWQIAVDNRVNRGDEIIALSVNLILGLRPLV